MSTTSNPFELLEIVSIESLLAPADVHFANQRRCGDYSPCVLCGRPVKIEKYTSRGYTGPDLLVPKKLAHLLDGEFSGGDMGHYPIGSECIKKVRAHLGDKFDDYIYTR